MSAPQFLVQSGTKIRDYVVREKIGIGGMTTVFLAQRQADGRIVAFKQLHPHIAIDGELVERFTRGAEIMTALRHPHIAEVYEYFKEGESYFQVEEYLQGGSLADYLEAHPGPVPEQRALSWSIQALLGIDHAHQHGVLHRDLKPGNLMRDAEGGVKITDFGIAKVLGARRVTDSGKQLGTPDYMSKEQILDPAQVTHLTDVYSMGVVLFELLTGRLPFEGSGSDSKSDFEIRRAVVQDPVPHPRSLNPSISRRLEGIIMKAMDKTPKKRFGGGAEFAEQIQQYLASSDLPVERQRDWRPIAVACGAAILMFSAGFWSGRRSAPKPDQGLPVPPPISSGDVKKQPVPDQQPSGIDPSPDPACQELVRVKAQLDQARQNNRSARSALGRDIVLEAQAERSLAENQQALENATQEMSRLLVRIALATPTEKQALEAQADLAKARISEEQAKHQGLVQNLTKAKNAKNLRQVQRDKAEQAERSAEKELQACTPG